MEAQVELSVENIGWGAMILSEMDALRDSGQLCDITIMVKEGSTVPAHSVVLSAASSFFKQVLEKAKKSTSSANSVVIKCGFTHEVIVSVCDFLYKGKALPLLSQIPEIQRAAKTFGISSLQTLCQVFTAQDTFQADSTITETSEEVIDSSEQVIEEQGAEVSHLVLAGESSTTEVVEYEDDVVCDEEIPEADHHDDHIPGDVVLAEEEDPTQTVETSILSGYSVVVATDDNNQPLDAAVVMRELQPEMIIGDYDVKTSNRKIYRYRCDLCPRIFTSKCRMEGHRATHLGDRIHKCTICGAGFIQSEYLREHMSVHSQDRPHQCTICDRSFRNARILKRHVFLHTGKKPFCCTICNAGFPRRDGLKNHMATHSSDKPFECSECGKAFSLMETLRRHMVLHSSNHPQHKCKYCDNAYRRKSSLLQHLAIHTGERKYACTKDGCLAGFRLPAQLKRHMRLLHGEHSVLNLEGKKVVYTTRVEAQEVGGEQQVEEEAAGVEDTEGVSTVDTGAGSANIIAVIDTVNV